MTPNAWLVEVTYTRYTEQSLLGDITIRFITDAEPGVEKTKHFVSFGPDEIMNEINAFAIDQSLVFH